MPHRSGYDTGIQPFGDRLSVHFCNCNCIAPRVGDNQDFAGCRWGRIFQADFDAESALLIPTATAMAGLFIACPITAAASVWTQLLAAADVPVEMFGLLVIAQMIRSYLPQVPTPHQKR